MGMRRNTTLSIVMMTVVLCRAHGSGGANGAFEHGSTEEPRASVVSAASVVSPANGTIRGHVQVHQPSADIASRPRVADLGMSATHGPADRRSVVYLDPAPRAAFDTREEPRPRMDQRDEMFVPHVLAIVAGTTVDFPNNDQTYHNVFSLSKTKSFDLGRYAVGRSKAVRFDRPGIVRVFCEIHSHMSAFILVFSHRYFSVVDGEGRYRLENVPPGTYTVVAWNESAPLESRRVVLPDAGGDVEINFALGRR
jgi:plastocyanin